jgi:hypothetical protein
MMSHIDCWSTLAAMWWASRRRHIERGRAMTASRSISTASTTTLTFWGSKTLRQKIVDLHRDGESFLGDSRRR